MVLSVAGLPPSFPHLRDFSTTSFLLSATPGLFLYNATYSIAVSCPLDVGRSLLSPSPDPVTDRRFLIIPALKAIFLTAAPRLGLSPLNGNGRQLLNIAGRMSDASDEGQSMYRWSR